VKIDKGQQNEGWQRGHDWHIVRGKISMVPKFLIGGIKMEFSCRTQ